MNALITLNYWVGIYAMAACVVFALVYSLITPWWKSTTGKLIMLLMGSLAALSAISVVFATYRDLEFVRTVRAVLVTLIGTAVWGHVISLVVVQARGRKDRLAERQRDG